MERWEAVEKVRPYVVQLSTPRSFGTGFFVPTGRPGVHAIATAAHVVNDSHWWEEPIRVYHPDSGKSQILRHGDRAIPFRHEMDTAVVMFFRLR